MYTLYTDKSEDFKCKIDVEGTKLSETRARLVIEGKDISLLFEGKIDSDGNCTVPIKKLKNLLSEEEKGTMRLEVIAEDTFFSPWEDDFTIKTNKKVTVEVFNNDKDVIKETKIGVKVDVQPTKEVIKPTSKKTVEKVIVEEKNHGKIISEILDKKGVKLTNVKENQKMITNFIKEYVIENKVGLSNNELLDEIINNLKY
jgi:hypothetical protein